MNGMRCNGRELHPETQFGKRGVKQLEELTCLNKRAGSDKGKTVLQAGSLREAHQQENTPSGGEEGEEGDCKEVSDAGTKQGTGSIRGYIWQAGVWPQRDTWTMVRSLDLSERE